MRAGRGDCLALPSTRAGSWGLQPSIDTDAVVLTSELEVALTVVGGEIAFRSEQVAIEEYQ